MSSDENLKNFMKQNRPLPPQDEASRTLEQVLARADHSGLLQKKTRSYYWLQAAIGSCVVIAASYWIQYKVAMDNKAALTSVRNELHLNFHDDENLSEVEDLLALGS